ncbi:MAG TPA: PKD domain-containing protein, partial [Thermoplasmata archaeon]|nr:PKD domain-containing protein [Thermoplasmata archaeon]
MAANIVAGFGLVVLLGCGSFGALGPVAGSSPAKLSGTSPPSVVGVVPASPGVGTPHLVPSGSNASASKWLPVSSPGAPPPRADAATAFDPVLNGTVVFGGLYTGGGCPAFTDCPSNDTWLYAGGTWSNLTPSHITPTDNPSPRWGAVLAYDPALGGLVLFGGASTTATGLNDPGLNDTWKFASASWSLVCPSLCAAPAPRWDASASYDLASSAIVVFGGETTNSGTISDLNDTWTFTAAGGWAPVTTGVAPSPRAGSAFAWDGQLGGAVLFGGIPANAQTWIFRNSTWRLVPLSGTSLTPTPRGVAAMAEDPLNGSVVLFGGCANLQCTGSRLSDTWVFAGNGWWNLTAGSASGPAARGLAGLVAGGPRGALLLIAGWTGAPSNDSWRLAHVEISAVSASPNVVDVGIPTHLSVNVSGGFGPARLTWTGLPSGCLSANVTNLTCTANGTGPYSASVSVTATDPTGEVVNATPAAVRFDPVPSLLLLATPEGGVAPLQVSFLAEATGGTGLLSVNWTFGDGTAGVGLNPTHTYSRGGTFHVNAAVTDADGVTAGRSVAISVLTRLSANASFSPSEVPLGQSSTLTVTVGAGYPP